MPVRQLPVSPDVQHVRRQAKNLLRAFRAGDASALADFREFGAKELDAARAKLSDAQLVLARSYGATSFAQLLAACEFILACWSNDSTRLRHAVLVHAGILKDYYKTSHDVWRDDLTAAVMQGTGLAIRSMRETGATIADALERQEHSRDWARILSTLRDLRIPMVRDRTRTPGPIVITAEAPATGRSQAEVQEDRRIASEKADAALKKEEEERRAGLEQLMRANAQDPTRTNRIFERMRAHNVTYPDSSALAPDQHWQHELMRECFRLYVQSHPKP